MNPARTRLRIVRVPGPHPDRLMLDGELDGAEHDNLRDAVVAVLRDRPGRPVEIDASGLTFLDSGGVRALLMCHDQARRAGAGAGLVMVAASLIVRQVLEITALLEMFGLRRSVPPA